MFGAWGLPGCLEFGVLPEQGVGDYQSLFCTQLQQHAPVGDAVADSMASQNSWPYSVVSSHSCIKVPHDDELVPTVHFPEEGPYVTLEGLSGRGVCHKCESVHTDELIAWRARQRDMGRSEYPTERLVSLLASVFFNMKPTSDRRRSSFLLADQYKVYPAPCSVSDPCAAKRTSPRAAIWCRCKVGLVPVPPVVSIVMIGQLRRSLALSGYSSMLT